VLVLPSAGSAEEGEPDYARNGFYVGVGGVFLYPADWDGDFEDSDFENSAGRVATNNAAAALEAIDEDARLEPPEVLITTSGVDLDELWGAGAVFGYRASPHLALEFEGEWIADSSESSFTIDNTGDRGKIEVDDLWTVTANVRVYPFTGRFQPFGIVGFGLYHADVDARGESNGNTTTGINDDPPPPDVLYEDIPADFSYRSSKTKTDGVLRAGLGLDAYVTPEIAIETKVDYVLPFVDTGLIKTDYLSVRVGVLYRF
jgi:opacity protein-like surface antigen